MTIHNIFFEAIPNGRVKGQIAALVIKNCLASALPCMIARFGSNEIKAVLYPRLPGIMQSVIRDRVLGNMATCAGFFPSNVDSIERFSSLMLADMRLLDVLGSWRVEESLLRTNFRNATLVELQYLEPYLAQEPWTQALAGKRVLVIHPFSKTISDQYHNKRAVLFKDGRVLPEFQSLTTIKAVQTIAGQKCEFSDWFEALQSMKNAIDAHEYDVAIIGCGAYGFPLAAHVKRAGKQAIHLGGATQILFGIKGKRWDTHPQIGPLYNEHWVRPSPEDVPQQANKVEDGCYW